MADRIAIPGQRQESQLRRRHYTQLRQRCASQSLSRHHGSRDWPQHRITGIRPLTHPPETAAPEIGAINSTPCRFQRLQFFVPMQCRAPKAVNDVRSHASARQNWLRNLASNLRLAYMAPISGASFWSVYQGPNAAYRRARH